MAAGAGYKVFTAGEVLTAADTNSFLASQVVMVFDNAAARATAIGTVTEGMVSYLKDTDSIESFSGASWQAVGGGEVGYEQTFLLMGA